MKNIAVNERNDIYIKDDGVLAINSGLAAVMQTCSNAAKAQLGEMILQTNRGVPNFQTVWNGAPNVAQFRAYLLRTLLSVQDVIEIRELTIDVTGGILNYQATIVTIYGTGVLNG